MLSFLTSDKILVKEVASIMKPFRNPLGSSISITTSKVLFDKKRSNMMKRNILILLLVITLVLAFSGCSNASDTVDNNSTSITNSNVGSFEDLNIDSLFTERDLEQNVDLSNSQVISLSDGQNVEITESGIYVLQGNATNVSVIVNADDEKVQLVLDGISISNDTNPCIYVKSADKVFVTTTDSENTLTVSGEFSADGETNTDAVIFSKDTLVINGTGTININSTKNAIASKDSLKVTGSTLNINCSNHGLEAKDVIAIYDGTITISSGKDGIHCENEDDDTKGLVYIYNGTLNIDAESDGIQGNAAVKIDGGTININSAEGIEGTYVQINGGTIEINGTDDGINAAQKSNSYDVVIEINGGDITINMSQGDTDALDSNGALYVNGGNLNLNGQFIFDFDTEAVHNGGTIIANGEEIDEIEDSMEGMMGAFGGKGNGKFGGEMPTDRTMPEMPTDGTMPEMPSDGTMPEMPTDGTMPEMPSDGTMPQMPTDGTKPQMPADGTRPQRPDNEFSANSNDTETSTASETSASST